MLSFNEDRLVEQLVRHEGIRLKVYKDSLGIDTIGVGRNIEDRGFSEFELNTLGKTLEEIYEDTNRHGLHREVMCTICKKEIRPSQYNCEH